MTALEILDALMAVGTPIWETPETKNLRVENGPVAPALREAIPNQKAAIKSLLKTDREEAVLYHRLSRARQILAPLEEADEQGTHRYVALLILFNQMLVRYELTVWQRTSTTTITRRDRTPV